ncbi:MAG: DUF2231 domain-containing protein [Actinomycetes bacterium]
MEIGGLPLHPLVVHAAVVLTPLAVLAVLAFAVRPAHRWLTRWPALLLTVAAFLSVWVARLSGQALLDSRPELRQLVAGHQERGEMLSLAVTVFLVLTALGAWALGGPSPLVSGRGSVASRGPLAERLLPWLLVLASLGTLLLAVLAGDSGARAVWGQ